MCVCVKETERGKQRQKQSERETERGDGEKNYVGAVESTETLKNQQNYYYVTNQSQKERRLLVKY